jgi:hypothetical protein
MSSLKLTSMKRATATQSLGDRSLLLVGEPLGASQGAQSVNSHLNDLQIERPTSRRSPNLSMSKLDCWLKTKQIASDYQLGQFRGRAVKIFDCVSCTHLDAKARFSSSHNWEAHRWRIDAPVPQMR